MGRLTTLLSVLIVSSQSGDNILDAIRSDAEEKGIPKSYLENTFFHKGIQTHDKIVERFARPYEKQSWTNYRKLFITDSRIKKGTHFYTEHQETLSAIAKNIKVDPFLILSIVGVESNYGRHQGEFTVFNALYTQIAKMPRRAKWAKKELIEFLIYCYNDNIPPHSIKGSYAGAFGYGQFIPSSFNTYAADGDGDGIRKPYEWSDVFASVGNYLAKNGYPINNPSDQEKVYQSVFAYNHADNYVKAVLELRDELKKNILIN
jgi:membrane-bound lytic murein transglycosylase B